MAKTKSGLFQQKTKHLFENCQQSVK